MKLIISTDVDFETFRLNTYDLDILLRCKYFQFNISYL